ncbi:RlmE family RNA methyltransferase [Marivibrio halodurans]|uniref:Ribosomal RNA large subunit methyltransferase E n=1 Tax=Marivibrio halodurans TaxID=2039722 RepID=A0A8J7V148_9PROT|nr:RlmE family RNA methyltransferase [Marivibrio halodurans]
MARKPGNKGSGGGQAGGNGGGKGGGKVSDARHKAVRVKTARGRKSSSTRWLQRQLNDPYVLEAKRLGYRGRAAFKLKEIDEKYDVLPRAGTVVDLGCAPGGWVQIARERLGKEPDGRERGRVVGIDLLACDPVPGAVLIEGDFTDDDAPAWLRAELDGPVDVVLSDMAANTTGHAPTDHLRTQALAELAYAFAEEVLKPGGNFVSKVFAGGTEKGLLDQLKRDFEKVAHFKPPASRKESPEMYVVAIGFRGGGEG